MDEAWTVTRLARTIKGRVETDFMPIWVRGELVGVKRAASGHWYFTLSDASAKIGCTMWKRDAGRLIAPLTDGTEVFVFGSPSVWEEQTKLSFNVTQVLPTSAVGAQAQAIEKIKQALLADGLLDPGRKRPLPLYASRIAVITSITGAAVRDIITVAQRRWPSVELLVINSAVQGERAPAELLHALEILSRLEAIDCCIIGRGGGGKEDLAAFNDEAVCRAIAASRVPVISAVGHEVDVTLADLVADVRAATPSQAAEFALPDRREVARHVDALASSLLGVTASLVRNEQERVQRTRERMGSALLDQLRTAERRLLASLSRLSPALERHARVPRERLARVQARLKPAIDRRVAARTADVQRLSAQLDALSPLAVLGRGFAMARDAQGRVLRKKSDFVRGGRFNLTVADGTVPARAEE